MLHVYTPHLINFLEAILGQFNFLEARKMGMNVSCLTTFRRNRMNGGFRCHIRK